MASYSNRVFGGLNRLLVSAAVAGAFFVLPQAAFACNNGVSAVNVYKECLPSGGGGKATGGGHKKAGTPTTSTSPAPAAVPVPVSKHTAKALKKAGTNGKSLTHLVRSFGAPRVLQSSSTGASEPTAVSSAFDVGSGPTALLIVLAGTAILLLGFSGVRGVRQRRH